MAPIFAAVFLPKIWYKIIKKKVSNIIREDHTKTFTLGIAQITFTPPITWVIIRVMVIMFGYVVMKMIKNIQIT